MKNKMTDMRDHLFVALERLNDADQKQLQNEIERAKAVAQIAQQLNESAKVELRARELIPGVKATGFLPELPAPGGDR